jgi:hypothetical protein
MTMDKQLWWWRDNEGTTINGKKQSTNAQHAQRQTSNDGRMMWRMTGRWRLKRHSGWSNGQVTTVGGGGVTMVLTTITKK